MNQLTIEEWQNKLKKSIYKADRETSKLSGFYKELFGLTSPRIKDLINNICDHPSIIYLELGVFRGSTIVASAINDSKMAYGIDNFSYSPYEANIWNSDGWPTIRRAVRDNLERAQVEHKVKIIEVDIRDPIITLSKVISEKVNVVFCDLSHVKGTDISIALEQINGTTDNLFVLIIGLYIDSDYKAATEQFIKDKKLTVHYKQELISQGRANDNGWYSGLGIFLLEKPKEKEQKK